jgi:virginiamycin B lyase
MRNRSLAIVAAVATFALCPWASPLYAQGQNPAALTGVVSSAEESAMEGVVVSAKRQGATATISVVSDGHGRYSFPETRLEPGQYTIRIRAVGYELDGTDTTQVAAEKTTTLDLKLRKTRKLASQLTNAEWMASMPGSDQQKSFMLECTGCHTLERVVKSQYEAADFVAILQRMVNYANMSTPLHPQRRLAERSPGPPDVVQKRAEYLASINLSGGTAWEYPLKTLPRPTGRATRVIMTEWDLPRQTMEPHDVIVASNGTVWFSNFGENFLARFDPHTGKVSEYPLPTVKPDAPKGTLDLNEDRDGKLWIALMYQSGFARFDPRTETFEFWRVPAEFDHLAVQQSMVMGLQSAVDGKVWTQDVDRRYILRLDLTSGKFEKIEPFRNLPKGQPHSAYGLKADAANNLYFMDFSHQNIGRIDAKTGEARLYPTPTPRSRPRRGMFDPEGRLWFGEYGANRIGMFDPSTEAFKEWEVPTPWSAPYDVAVDRNGEAWTGSMWNDRITRLDPKTGQFTEYLLPRSTNIRRVFVDDSTNPVTFWVGSNHGASIIRLEPLE